MTQITSYYKRCINTGYRIKLSLHSKCLAIEKCPY